MDTVDLTDLDRDGLHIIDGADDDDLLDETTDHDDPLPDLVDGFAEAYNAHDLDGTLELLTDDAELPGLGGDVGGFPAAVERLWDERPTAVLTRGWLDDRAVAVLWDACDDSGWCRVGLLTFDGADGALEVVELVGDSPLIDEAEAEAPELDLLEGTRWDEWDEGAG